MASTPHAYWRVAATVEAMQTPPAADFRLPASFAERKRQVQPGDGVLLADYVSDDESGLVKHIGLVESATSEAARMSWRPVDATIWVDSTMGRRFWQQPDGFMFAAKKLVDYGLHDIFADKFDGLQAPELMVTVPGGQPRPRPTSVAPRSSKVAPERLIPREIIGEPTDATGGGYVYVLDSRYGQKVGHTKSMPNRMRTFGVKLPFLYTIPLCAWFDDRVAAESYYHRLFQPKRLDGEWFTLTEADVDAIRRRVAAQA